MEKRLPRSAYIFTLLFLFMLICAIGAFFSGMQVGTHRTETKYKNLIVKDQAKSHELAAYHQQYLVSFYHTIYSPYVNFQKKWFESSNELVNHGTTVDASALLKELHKLANTSYDSIQEGNMPSSSPLLVNAQTNYLKSLKLFATATDRFEGRANKMKPGDLLAAINQDAYYKEARNFALKAQLSYYSAIQKWQESTNRQLKPHNALAKKNLTIAEWKKLTLLEKNEWISSCMLTDQIFAPYQPQDLTLHIDDFIYSGQVRQRGLKTVCDIVDILNDTGAVRENDYLEGKDKRYLAESVPQLPIF